jgi:hypothetical protein
MTEYGLYIDGAWPLPLGGRAGSVSGTGRVGGAYPVDAFTEAKTVTFPAPRLGPGSG